MTDAVVMVLLIGAGLFALGVVLVVIYYLGVAAVIAAQGSIEHASIPAILFSGVLVLAGLLLLIFFLVGFVRFSWYAWA